MAEEIKALQSGVVDIAQDIPVIGEVVKFVGEPLKEGLNLFTDNVLSPIFGLRDERREGIKRDWEQYVKEASLHRYGQEMTPDEYRMMKFEDKKTRLSGRAMERAAAQQEYEQKAQDMGYGSTAEYSKAVRESKKQSRLNPLLQEQLAQRRELSRIKYVNSKRF